ncbi:HAD-IA family hydrolase [Metabacillus malikii]|uniref:Phosphoglycolate phosphatase n=1 Tax=Metabacillus malikii TaxID=1504265 RepID=A0ABT9ZIH3_9BACI|nr:HAD-IA family hydrolase [Metabacillus malikii]MDQ0232079.1 phosphoglycolate phosphatase [Metabacillus malikii]
MNILWDFDGTLFDTYPGYTKIFSQVLEVEAPKDEIYKRLKVSLSHAIDYYRLTENQVKEMEQLKRQLLPEDSLPFEHVEEILKYADKNVIMTHKDRAGVLDILKHYGWEKYFVDMVASDDGYPRKPDAASYRYLHEKHHIDLVIGDRDLDLIPGKELGIKTCAFGTKSEVADYYLENYADFFQVIESNRQK